MVVGDFMKKIVYVLLGIVGLWVILFALNYSFCKQNKQPLIVFKTVQYEENDTHIVEYYSLGYKVIIKEQGWIKEGSMKPLWEKTMPDVKFIVLDETGDTCISGKTYFYEDNYYQYYFNCNKKIKIQMDNKTYDVKTALQNGLITIEELREKLSFNKESKVPFTMEVTTDKACSSLQENPSKLVQVKDGLYYYCLGNVNIYVNRNYSSFQEAFGNTIQTDMITIEMHQERSYDNGAIMYANNSYRMLVCPNKDVILGPIYMEYFDTFCQ